MLKILFVEDNFEKIKKLTRAAQHQGVTLDDIDVVHSSNDAKQKLIASYYDILFLDISIPRRIDQDPLPFEGVSLLKDVLRRDEFNTPAYITGITSHSDVHAEHEDFFKENNFCLFLYDLASNSCEKMIQEQIEFVLKAKRAKEDQKKDYESHLAIVCALEDPELKAVLKNGWNWTPVDISGDDICYYRALVPTIEGEKTAYAAYAPQMGMVSASILTMKMIHHFQPKYIAMTGITGGMPEAGNLGDVVVAESVWDWGCGKWKADGENCVFHPAPYQTPIAPSIRRIVQRFREKTENLIKIAEGWPSDTPGTKLQVLLGPMVSGASVIANSQKRDAILEQHRKILAFDMEATAIASACQESIAPKPSWIVLKSIVDFGNAHKGDSVQKYGAYTSSEVLKILAEEYLD